MPFLRFYGHFAAAYGTIWLIFVLSISFNGHAETGEFGLYGFPVIALVYALLRTSMGNNQDYELRNLRDRISRLENSDS